MKKPSGYWNIKENVFEEAKKYKTKTEFFKGCVRGYNVARRNGWLDEMDWFIEGKRPNGYWTKENVFTEAKKYQTRTKFCRGCSSAYDVAKQNGWLSKMTWFVSPQKPDGYWTKERVFEEARKYQTRGEFSKSCKGAYKIARVNGWLDEMTWLIEGRLKAFTIKKNDSVYKYYFKETNSIYIGRTLITQQKERDSKHSTSEKDAVFRHAKANGLAVPPMEIIEENITVKEGLEREDYWVNYYKEKGYNVLNTGKTGIGSGSIGAIANGKWNKESVFEEAKKYKTKSSFAKFCSGAYGVARKNGWLDEISFKEGKRPNGYWRKERIFEEARKYPTKNVFRKGCMTAYTYAIRNGWINEMDWFKEIKKPNGYWTKETVFEEARKYQTRCEFQKGCSRAYKVARENKWLDELFPKKCAA